MFIRMANFIRLIVATILILTACAGSNVGKDVTPSTKTKQQQTLDDADKAQRELTKYTNEQNNDINVNKKPNEDEEEMLDKREPDNKEMLILPHWVVNPKINGHELAEVGMSKYIGQDDDTRRQTALIDLKTKLSKQQYVNLKSERMQNRTGTNYKIDEQSGNYVGEIRILSEYVSRNGNYYIWGEPK